MSPGCCHFISLELRFFHSTIQTSPYLAFSPRGLKSVASIVHHFPTWDLNKVLTALMSSPFEPLHLVALQFLSFKVTFLIAIKLACHILELAALSMRDDLCLFHPDRVVLRLDPTFLPKVNSLFHHAQELVLPNLCPTPAHRLECSWHALDV